MAVDGYRLRVRDIRDLSQVMEGFRADALRILARSYGRLVAHEAVRLADLHAIGIPDPSSTTAGPLADANEAMRKAYLEAAGNGEFDLNCEVVIYFVGDAVLARFLSGNASYRKAWEARREVVRWGWSRSVERPKGLSEHNWKIREICWRNALAKSGLGSGLRFILLEGGASRARLGRGSPISSDYRRENQGTGVRGPTRGIAPGGVTGRDACHRA